MNTPAHHTSPDIIKTGPTIKESDIDQICMQLSHIKHEYQVLRLCTIPFEHNGIKEYIDIMLDPVQDFMDPQMLQNTYKSQDIGNYNFLFIDKTHKKQYITYAITKDKQLYIDAIKQHPKLEQMLRVVRGKLLLQTPLEFDPSPQSLAQHIIQTSKSIWNSFNQQGKAAQLSHLTHDTTVQVTRDHSVFEWHNKLYTEHPIRKKLLLAAQNQNNHRTQLHHTIIKPLKRGRKNLQLDAKFLYMDNGNQLYTQILYNSYYHDYVEQETKLLDIFGEQYGHIIQGKYIGLGAGNGSKDFHLLKYTSKDVQKIFIDSSMTALQEAELLCRSGTQRAGFGFTHADNVLLSQDWIDAFVEYKPEVDGLGRIPTRGIGIDVLQSTFHNPHPIRYNLASLYEDHTFRSIPGGTFGNFGSYQTTFLQQLDTIMQTGDHILISVFNKPKNDKEIKDIIAHYDTPQTYDFVTNFFTKIGVPKEHIQVHITYEHNVVNIIAIIAPPITGLKLSCYDRRTTITKPITITIGQSQRMTQQDFTTTLTKAKTHLHIQDIITTPDNPMSLYLLQKF